MLSLPDELPASSVAELRRQALLPVNQAAALKLIQAGVSVESGIQPVFQLMEWAITNDKRKRFEDIAHELYVLRTSPDQADALACLFANAPGGVRAAARTILRRSPGSAARTLLDLFDILIKSDPKKI
jgi:hypothetical protein